MMDNVMNISNLSCNRHCEPQGTKWEAIYSKTRLRRSYPTLNDVLRFFGNDFKKYSVLLILIIVLGAFSNSIAQNYKASSKIDTNKIAIGDQVNLKLQFTFPVNSRINWADFTDTLTQSVEVVSRSKFDSTVSSDKKFLTLSQTLRITSFDSGNYVIPPFVFGYFKPNDTTKFEILTDSLLFHVQTVAVDTTKAIKDLKGIMSAPLTFEEILPYILVGVAAILVSLLIFWYIMRRRKNKPLFTLPEKPKIPAHIIALEELEKLRNQKLWQSGKVKDYHTFLTDILRIYIEKQFGIYAMEMTSDEIIAALKPQNITEESKTKMRNILFTADLVKFAKSQPLPSEHDLSLNYAVEFVNGTIPAKSNNVNEINN